MIFGADLGFHRREPNSHQNDRGKSMKFDFEARSATFEEMLDANFMIFQRARKNESEIQAVFGTSLFQGLFLCEMSEIGGGALFLALFSSGGSARKQGGRVATLFGKKRSHTHHWGCFERH